jgi:uncharacterized repeat protein (TIGR01451 family)
VGFYEPLTIFCHYSSVIFRDVGGKMSGFAIDMSRFWKLDMAYGAALIAAAAIGSAVAFAVPARAQTAPAPTVSLVNEAKVERTEIGADGREKTVLKSPSDVIVVPGDRVVFTLKYHNKGASPANGFRATNPMPGPVQFIGASEDWAEVSVDGGKSWGKLAALTVKAKSADGASDISRPAGAEDVTHVRWVFASAIAPGAEGTISFRGVVK